MRLDLATAAGAFGGAFGSAGKGTESESLDQLLGSPSAPRLAPLAPSAAVFALGLELPAAAMRDEAGPSLARGGILGYMCVYAPVVARSTSQLVA